MFTVRHDSTNDDILCRISVPLTGSITNYAQSSFLSFKMPQRKKFAKPSDLWDSKCLIWPSAGQWFSGHNKYRSLRRTLGQKWITQTNILFALLMDRGIIIFIRNQRNSFQLTVVWFGLVWLNFEEIERSVTQSMTSTSIFRRERNILYSVNNVCCQNCSFFDFDSRLWRIHTALFIYLFV